MSGLTATIAEADKAGPVVTAAIAKASAATRTPDFERIEEDTTKRRQSPNFPMAPPKAD